MVLLGGGNAAIAQQHQHPASPYAGQEHRAIKALSDSQIQQLSNGEGMSLALAAELNHYPGPRHVIALARSLDLSKKQLQQVESIARDMDAKAKELGLMIIAKERQMDAAFRDRAMDEGALRGLTADVAKLQGDLRYVHLAAHLEVRKVLNEKQVAAYDRLRGYAPGGGK